VELRKIEDLPQIVKDMENVKADKRQVVVF